MGQRQSGAAGRVRAAEVLYSCVRLSTVTASRSAWRSAAPRSVLLQCSKPCAAALTDRCDALIKRSTDHATLLFCSVLEFGPVPTSRRAGPGAYFTLRGYSSLSLLYTTRRRGHTDARDNRVSPGGCRSRLETRDRQRWPGGAALTHTWAHAHIDLHTTLCKRSHEL